MLSFAKLHYYSGLFLLQFLWLFALTGLLLNHPQWTFAEFWPNRTQTNMSRSIQPPPAGSDLVQARAIMNQLGVRGEIEWTKARANQSRLEFRVSRPGRIYEISADLEKNVATIREIDLNGWGIARLLHTFIGVRGSNPANDRDWILTTVWAVCMDVVAGGSILMVLSGLYMWWRQREKRIAGLAALGLGVLSCGFFVFGLRWLF